MVSYSFLSFLCIEGIRVLVGPFPYLSWGFGWLYLVLQHAPCPPKASGDAELVGCFCLWHLLPMELIFQVEKARELVSSVCGISCG